MGGAGTGVPPVELLLEPPLLELDVEDELLVDEDVEELVLPPKLDDPPVDVLELDPPDELDPDEPELPPVEPP